MITLQPPQKTLLHVKLYATSSEKHGGVKRTKQLSEIIADIGCDHLVQDIAAPELTYDIPKLLTSGLITRAFWHVVHRRLSLRGALTFALRGSALLRLVEKINPTIVLLETGPGRSLLLPQVLAFHNIPFITFPHNIEGLVPGQIQTSFPTQWQGLAWERAAYSAAERTFTISDFDAAILRTMGVAASCLPYFPAKADQINFRRVRERRTESEKTFALILGTVRNPPTRIGMQRLLADLASEHDSDHYVVAGYGTEELGHFASPNISIKGGVSDSELEELLVGCQYVLVQQVQTTGLMTRMTEMNLAGVPLLIVGQYAQADNLDRYGIYRVSSRQAAHPQIQTADLMSAPTDTITELSALIAETKP